MSGKHISRQPFDDTKSRFERRIISGSCPLEKRRLCSHKRAPRRAHPIERVSAIVLANAAGADRVGHDEHLEPRGGQAQHGLHDAHVRFNPRHDELVASLHEPRCKLRVIRGSEIRLAENFIRREAPAQALNHRPYLRGTMLRQNLRDPEHPRRRDHRVAPSDQRLTPLDMRRKPLLHIYDDQLRPVPVQPSPSTHQSEASDFEGERGNATILGVSGAKHPTAQHLPGWRLRVMRRVSSASTPRSSSRSTRSTLLPIG